MLFVFLIICHYLADFTHLQSDWMVNGKKNLSLLPIFAHAGIHAALMLIPLLMWTTVIGALTLAALQFGAHFGIDFAKGFVNKKFTKLNGTKWEWYIFGADQLAHTLIVYLIFVIATS